jgi:nicotinamidase-related amidase
VNPNFIQRLCQLNGGEFPECVFIVGIDTDCCVLSIATALFETNIRPIVLTGYCASNGGMESHDAGIQCMKRLIGERQLMEKEILSIEDLK